MPAVMGQDKIRLNHRLLFCLPFMEATGQISMDTAKPHHPVTGHNLTWATGLPIIPSQLGLAVFNGASTYLDSPAADTVDLNFTAEDYTITAWIYYQATGLSQIVTGRYGVDLDGWELYLYDINQTLNLRHHHSSLAPARTGCYSEGWAPGAWHLLGISRSGRYPLHFRNGAGLEVFYDVGGLDDPDTCNRDLVIGTRYTKNANWYSGYKVLLRIWEGAFEEWEHDQLFEMERHWFGL